MNKIRLKYIAGFVIGALLCGCNDSESDLLETKVYFEESSVLLKPRVMMLLPMICRRDFLSKVLHRQR